MRRIGLAMRAALAASLMVWTVSAEVTVAFDGTGLAGLTAGDGELLTDGRLVVRRVVLADGWRNRNAEPDDTMYRPDTRSFRDARTIPFEQHFEAGANRLMQLHEWGELTVDYRPGPDRLDLDITIANTGDETIEYVELELASLALPGTVTSQLASGIPGFMRSNWNIEGPDIWQADFESGRMVFVSLRPEESLQQRVAVRDGTQVLTVTAGSPDGGREVYDMVWNVRPVPAGGTDRYTLSLRFSAPHVSPFETARDVLEAYGKAVPMLTHWPDRRPIGALHIGDARRDKRNPRGWFVLTHDASFPAASDPGYTEAFRAAMLKNAGQVIAVARQLGMQGVIVWQIEGMQEPGHAYYGEPRILPYAAPEMDAVADDYFRTLREAGLRVGVTLRPVIQAPFNPEEGSHSGALLGVTDWNALREAAIQADWSIQFRNLSWMQAIPEPLREFYDADEAWSMLVRLDNKIRYANERWGATLFYLDANNAYRPRTRGETFENWGGRPIPARLVEELQRRHPDCLIVGEHQNFRYWTSGAQYVQPPHFGQRVTPEEVRIAYPDAMSVVAAVATEPLFLAGDHFAVYRDGILNGDTFLLHGWYGGHARLAQNLFGATAMLAPFQIVLQADAIDLNGEQLESPAALEAALRRHLEAPRPLSQRRAFIRYHSERSPAELEAVLEAVTNAGGIIAWSMVDDGPWQGFWGPKHPLQSQTPEARAIVYPDPDSRGQAVRVLIANAAAETRIVTFELDAARLGIGAQSPDEVFVEHLDALWAERAEEPPPTAGSAPAPGGATADAVAADLLESLDLDLTRSEQLAVSREDFRFDDTNVHLANGTLSLKVEANGFRSLVLRRIR